MILLSLIEATMLALVLNAPFIICLRKSKLRKIYLAIKEAEFELESGGVMPDRRVEQKGIKSIRTTGVKPNFFKGSLLLLDSTCKFTP